MEDQMLADSRIVYLFLYVTDLAVSRAFYLEKVGLQIIEEDSDCVKFDAGSVILALNRASDYGIKLPHYRDNSNDIVFLVKDAEATRAVLEGRGLKLLPTSAYQPGKIIDFYDPDGHWLSLYEPSKEAMGWPSGDRIRAVLKSRQGRHAARAAAGRPIIAGGLDGNEIFYTFFFVADPDVARDFYNGTLGIRALEGGPCSQTCTGDEQGVIKYDTGSLTLTTHHAFGAMTPDMQIIAPAPVDPDEHACPPRSIDLKSMRGVGAAFWVGDLDASVKALKQQRPDTTVRVTRNGIGAVATIEEPTGHLLFLYEPSEAALATPSGRKIQEILNTPLPDRDLAALREMVPADEFRQDITWEGVPAC
jgi:catechol 2,3-dioxygenase-like lactoylglutathione lyase family enzyme